MKTISLILDGIMITCSVLFITNGTKVHPVLLLIAWVIILLDDIRKD
jgi:hypothetical protein